MVGATGDPRRRPSRVRKAFPAHGEGGIRRYPARRMTDEVFFVGSWEDLAALGDLIRRYAPPSPCGGGGKPEPAVLRPSSAVGAHQVAPVVLRRRPVRGAIRGSFPTRTPAVLRRRPVRGAIRGSLPTRTPAVLRRRPVRGAIRGSLPTRRRPSRARSAEHCSAKSAQDNETRNRQPMVGATGDPRRRPSRGSVRGQSGSCIIRRTIVK